MAFAKIGDTKRAWELLSLINPINHAKTAEDVRKYKVEPYVVASDVYSKIPYSGRGGWTWYTGSSGWMYRLIIEVLLGLRIEGDKLHVVSPCLPADWPSVTIHYKYKSTYYHITIKNSPGCRNIDQVIPLVDDGINRDRALF
jgi:cellobiose phosphorylase